MKILLILLFLFLNFKSVAFPIPTNNIVKFDVIRKNKIIGSVETTFTEKDSNLIIQTIVDINVKILFIPAYKFFQKTTEIWKNNEFIEFEGYTDFEDDREYFIKGKDTENNFVVTGMDGEIITQLNILPLNYWNKEILRQEKIFDTQKGIVRDINVKKLDNEKIIINNIEILAEKYILNASKNPKDLGPFPEYTIWYGKNDELIKFQFKNPKDKKIIITQRSDLSIK